MKHRIALYLRGINARHLLLIIVLSEIFSAIMNTIMGIIWWGSVSLDLILIGTIDALVVSVIVGLAVLPLYARLLQSERRFRTLISNASDAICTVDQRGSFIEVNRQMEELSGYSQQELAKMTFMQLHTADEVARIVESFQSAMGTGSGSLQDISLRRKDGRTVPIELTGSFIDVGGSVIGQAIIRDISEKKTAQENIRLYQEQLERLVEERTLDLSKTVWNLNNEILEHRQAETDVRKLHEFSEAILHSMKDAVAIINPDTYGIVKVNAAFETFFQADGANLIGKTCHKVLHNSDRPCGDAGEDCPLARTLSTGAHASFEHMHFTPSGLMRHVEDSTSPIRDSYGRIVQIVHLSRDITERTLTEMALRESEHRFHELFMQNEDALFLLDTPKHEVISANPMAEQLFGYPPADFAGSTLERIFAPEHYTKFRSLLSDAMRTGSLRIDRISNLRRGGSSIETSVRGRLVRLKDRQVIYCSFRDITEKIRLEEEARFIQTRLIQANRMTSLGTLVSGVAHEINNPNNYILFNAQLLREAWADIARILEQLPAGGDVTIAGLPLSEAREALPKLAEGIADGSDRIKNIVKNLKDFARQESADLDASVNVNDVILTAVALMNNQIRKTTHRLSLELAGELPAVRGNTQQLEQVVINLLINAMQALPDPDHGVTVATEYDAGRHQVTIRVSDEGSGIPEELLDRVMEPFFTTRLDRGGTGLGLSISYSIVKNHGGAIAFASTPGRGTTVTVTLPQLEEA